MVKEIITFLLGPLMNQRGQLGVYPHNIQIGNPGSFEEMTEYSPFETTSVSPQYGDLIARYQALLGGGAGSYDAYQNLQTNQMLERIKNLGASKGLGSRSGVTLAAHSRAMGEAGPRYAREKADYMRGLIGDYGSAVSQGRTSRSALPTKTTRKAAPSAEGTGTKASSPFQYIPSNPYSGGGGGGSAPGGGGGSGGSAGGTGGMLPGGSLENFFAGVGGAGSAGPNFYGPSGQYEGMPSYQSLEGTPYAQSSGGGSYRETYNPLTRSWSMPGS